VVVIYDSGFVSEGGVGTYMKDQWAQTQDGVDIDGERLFPPSPRRQQPSASMPMKRRQ
jgi:hypothetical protein